ncbi:hypothetical protein HPB51_003733 [Rhipicephalus microplus]|uniref:RNA polymerase II subunit A C-terminal domain phosphatase SSU72 n=1 Tax=Rhipicephalus microplus TaxID=6941 RepID=A0A9J6EXH6_RHIMP|nr:hypothetical protein HPB51_003733 [Rhipicephalus microplus]
MPGSLRLAVVCSSNQNRSMEAHAFLRCVVGAVSVSHSVRGWRRETKKMRENGRHSARTGRGTGLSVTQAGNSGEAKKGFKVRSFGSGAQVKLPGSAPDKPNVYDFGVTYEQMYQDLMEKDKALYPCLFSNTSCFSPVRIF